MASGSVTSCPHGRPGSPGGRGQQRGQHVEESLSPAGRQVIGGRAGAQGQVRPDRHADGQAGACPGLRDHHTGIEPRVGSSRPGGQPHGERAEALGRVQLHLDGHEAVAGPHTERDRAGVPERAEQHGPGGLDEVLPGNAERRGRVPQPLPHVVGEPPGRGGVVLAHEHPHFSSASASASTAWWVALSSGHSAARDKTSATWDHQPVR